MFDFVLSCYLILEGPPFGVGERIWPWFSGSSWIQIKVIKYSQNKLRRFV